MLTKEEARIVEMVQTAYISVMGQSKWDSFTPQEKHDVTMILIKEALRLMD